MNVIILAEHDIFGEAVSDSDDDEDAPINVMEVDENSHLSVDSRVSDSNSLQVQYSNQLVNVPSTSGTSLVTEFTKDMFNFENADENIKIEIKEEQVPKVDTVDEYACNEITESFIEPQNIVISRDAIEARREELQADISKLQEQRQQQEEALANIVNMSLRERFQARIDNLMAEEVQKIQEV